MVNDCRRCEYYENIGDGYGMCTDEAIPVLVVDNYEPTDKFMQCLKCKQVLSGVQYGQMAYQKEDTNENSV